MNTPKPCVTCAFLYADCMHDDDPAYCAECWLHRLGTTIGDASCPHYSHWEMTSNEARDAKIDASRQRVTKVTKVCNECCGSGWALKLCTDCGGSGKVGRKSCGSCNGSGGAMEACPACKGTGKVEEVEGDSTGDEDSTYTDMVVKVLLEADKSPSLSLARSAECHCRCCSTCKHLVPNEKESRSRWVWWCSLRSFATEREHSCERWEVFQSRQLRPGSYRYHGV